MKTLLKYTYIFILCAVSILPAWSVNKEDVAISAFRNSCGFDYRCMQFGSHLVSCSQLEEDIPFEAFPEA